MARPREFDEEKALDQAMRLFWTQGYQGTSLHDLLQTMGISKSSFYETFGSKRDLFMRSLEHFDKTQALHAVTKLDEDVPVKTIIAEMFAVIIDRAVNQKHGCMFGKSAVELSHRDPVVRKRAAAGIRSVEDTFHKAVVRGKKSGELSKHCEARLLARSLTATFYGLQVMGNANVPQKVLKDVVSAALKELD